MRAVSNPAGLAIESGTGTLYVLEQNTLRGYSYETFHGDVLAFCKGGQYDCSLAQNAGECSCADGYGGSCCDIPLALGGSLLATVRHHRQPAARAERTIGTSLRRELTPNPTLARAPR